MKLTDKDGYSITFEVSGYECDCPNEGWLNITTFVTHPLGTWKTIDPSLLTDELESLRDFFKSIIINPEKSIDLFFLEPNLSFQYLSVKSKKTLKILFYIESRTHWLKKNDDNLDLTNLSLEIPFDLYDFISAFESIAKYCVEYPRRIKKT